MSPFTDFSFLKQAFTEAEPWKVKPRRAEMALAAGAISREQAERFRDLGALGSHLEILQRDDGYKGFNQTGINEIIRATDPRGAREVSGADTSIDRVLARLNLTCGSPAAANGRLAGTARAAQ